jgi:hypothetical protein
MEHQLVVLLAPQRQTIKTKASKKVALVVQASAIRGIYEIEQNAY